MKKPKFLMKIDSNNNAKIYLNKKWVKECTWISVLGKLDGYHIELEKYALDSKGRHIIENNELKEIKEIHDIKR